jgi:hypothetical protein
MQSKYGIDASHHNAGEQMDVPANLHFINKAALAIAEESPRRLNSDSFRGTNAIDIGCG